MGKCVPLKLIMILFYVHWEIRGNYLRIYPGMRQNPKENSIYFYNKICTGTARLAHPETDLHCIKVSVERTRLHTLNLNEKGMTFYMGEQ